MYLRTYSQINYVLIFHLIVGGFGYVLYIAQLIHPNNILLYGASALVGFGAALIWVAQVSSTKKVKIILHR